MLTFKELYNITAEATRAAKEPLVKNRNKRAVAAAIDNALEQKATAEEQLEKELGVISDGKVINLNNVLQLRSTIEAADETVLALKKFDEEFFKD